MKSNTIFSRFKELVGKTPDAAAVIEEDRTVSYSQLDYMVDCILAKFDDIRPEYVGIVMSHGAEQIAAMLAVLKSAAAISLPNPPCLKNASTT